MCPPVQADGKWPDTQVCPYARMRGMQGRKSIRLPGYDYASPGFYFLTACVHRRRLLFGEIMNGQMDANPAGEMIHRWWRELPNKFSAVRLDAMVIMPNHFHALVVISNVPVGADLCARPAKLLPSDSLPSLSQIVQWFKTMTTNDYFHEVKSGNWPAVSGRLWQRNYFEHIVRRTRSLDRIRNYIVENPKRWEFDRENPSAVPEGRDDIDSIIAEDLEP